MIDPLALAKAKVDRLVANIHECAPDHSVDQVRVGDLRFIQKMLALAAKQTEAA